MTRPTQELLSNINNMAEAYKIRKQDIFERDFTEAEMENGFLASEDIERVFSLQKKRLEKRNMKMHTEEKNFCRIPLQTINFFQDGKCKVTQFNKRIRRKVSYYRNKQLLRQVDKNTAIRYYISAEPDEGHKLTSVDVHNRQEVFGRSDEFGKPERFSWEKALSLCRVFFTVLVLIVLVLLLRLIIRSRFGNMFFRMGDLLIFFLTMDFAGIVLESRSLKEIWVNYKRRASSKRVVEEIRKNMPDFSVEKFISMADSRVKCLYYAERYDDIADFLNDLSQGNGTRDKIVNCDLVNFWFDKYYQDEENQYLTVTHRGFLMMDNRSIVSEKKVDFQVNFVKPLNSIMSMDDYHDWYMEINGDLLKVEKADRICKGGKENVSG